MRVGSIYNPGITPHKCTSESLVTCIREVQQVLVYPHRSKPAIMDLIEETHLCVQCIPLRQPFNLLTLILILEVIISNVSPL